MNASYIANLMEPALIIVVLNLYILRKQEHRFLIEAFKLFIVLVEIDSYIYSMLVFFFVTSSLYVKSA